jgi:hypothetical protein
MDLMKIGLYGLAGFGAYAAYEHFSKPKTSTVPPIEGAEPTSSFTGTNWQQSGRNRETMWQEGNVFSNAAGRGYFSPRPRPTGYDGRQAMPSADNNWLAAIPGRKRVPSADNNWLAAIPRSRYRNMSGLQGTDWQTSNMSNACGDYSNMSGLQGTDWQTTNMSNACGSCGA